MTGFRVYYWLCTKWKQNIKSNQIRPTRLFLLTFDTVKIHFTRRTFCSIHYVHEFWYCCLHFCMHSPSINVCPIMPVFNGDRIYEMIKTAHLWALRILCHSKRKEEKKKKLFDEMRNDGEWRRKSAKWKIESFFTFADSESIRQNIHWNKQTNLQTCCDYTLNWNIVICF